MRLILMLLILLLSAVILFFISKKSRAHFALLTKIDHRFEKYTSMNDLVGNWSMSLSVQLMLFYVWSPVFFDPVPGKFEELKVDIRRSLWISYLCGVSIALILAVSYIFNI